MIKIKDVRTAMVKTPKEKKITYRRLPEADYKKFRRREKQLMRAKAYMREAWRILGQMN